MPLISCWANCCKKEPMSIIPVLLISWIKRNEAVVTPQPAPLQKLIVDFYQGLIFVLKV